MEFEGGTGLTERVKALLNEAFAIRVSDAMKSIDLANEALSISRAGGDELLIAQSLSKLSLFYMITGKNELAVDRAEEAIAFFEAIGDELGVAEAKYSIAGTQYKTDQFYLGLVSLSECLVIYKKHGDHLNMARVYKSMATIYEYFGDIQKAVQTYEQSINAAIQADSPNAVSNALNPLSGIHLSRGNVEEASKLIEKAIEMKTASGDLRGFAFSLYGRGKVWLHKGIFDNAEADLKESIRIHREMNEHLGECMALRKLGQLYFQNGNLSMAKKVAEEALNVSKEYSIGLTKVNALHLLYLISKEENKVDQALKLLEEYTKEKELLLNDRSTKLIQSFDMVSKLQALEAEAELQKEKNTIIEKKNKELDSFFHRVAHDLKGSVTSLMSADTLLRMQIQDQQALSLMDLSAEQIKRINQILDELMTLTKVTHMQANQETIDFNQMVDECISSLSTIDNFGRVRIEKDISFRKPFKAPWILINTIFQNLIENGIKYAKPDADDSFVLIEIMEDHSLLKIRVTDNGIGMNEESGDSIFEMFYRATSNSSGSGLGLYILSRAVEQLGGTVDVKSEIEKGSVFTVLLPLE